MKINRILALLAVIGGLSAAFTNHSEKNRLYPGWKYGKERIQGKKVHFISATHLADLLYEKEQGISLLDLRGEEAYGEYHIPSAQSLDGNAEIDEQASGGMVIIYGSEDEERLVEQSSSGTGRIFVLKGGIEAWYELVLFPDFTEYQVRNHEKLEHIINRSRYFGGNPGNTLFLNLQEKESRFREGC